VTAEVGSVGGEIVKRTRDGPRLAARHVVVKRLAVDLAAALAKPICQLVRPSDSSSGIDTTVRM